MCICPTKKADSFFQHDFAKYQKELKYLFEVYTDKEIETLFLLLSKLYAGIGHLEQKTASEADHPAMETTNRQKQGGNNK